MVLKASSKIIKNPNATTQQITIPATMVVDSQYPFKPGEEVEVRIDLRTRTLIVSSMEVSK